MNSVSKWIEHLHHPLVFAGFGLFLLALLLRPLFLNNKKISGAGMERLLSRGMILIFVLALLSIIGGVTLLNSTGNKQQDKVASNKPQSVRQQNSGGNTMGATVKQATEGIQSPAINSGKDVRINYGAIPTESKQSVDTSQTHSEKPQAESAQIEQTTKGKQSPTITTQGDVEINYGK
ncbi:hypothetical protein GKODMF_09240 [Candidatus Electrothrix gigas]